MWERRVAVCLCVLVAHAIAVYLLDQPRKRRPTASADAGSEPITLELPPVQLPLPPADSPRPRPNYRAKPAGDTPRPPAAAPRAADAGTPAVQAPAFVDLDEQGRKAAERVVAAQAERDRVAGMFSGHRPGSFAIAPRPAAPAGRMRWQKRLNPFDFDADGRVIMWLSEDCYLRLASPPKVSRCQTEPGSEACKAEAGNTKSTKMMCFIGRNAHGDMFKDMQIEMDAQRLPDAEVP